MSKPEDVPFETTLLVRDTCLCLHTQRAARALARRFDQALRPWRLTDGQFSLLMALNRPKPPSNGPRSCAARDGSDDPNGRAQAPAKAWLGRLLHLTRDGRALLGEAVPICEATHGAIEQLLPGGDANLLRTSLRALA